MSENQCRGRREFLVKTTGVAGGLLLSVAGLNRAEAAENDAQTGEMTFKLDKKSPLSQIGGSYSFDYKGEPIIIVRKTATDFVALSAVCTHKGGTLGYNEKTQKLVCPLHNSVFGLDGQRISGPAKQPLRIYGAQNAVVIDFNS